MGKGGEAKKNEYEIRRDTETKRGRWQVRMGLYDIIMVNMFTDGDKAGTIAEHDTSMGTGDRETGRGREGERARGRG